MPFEMRPTTLKVSAAFGAMLALASGCASLDEWQRRSIFQHESSIRYGDREPPPGGLAFELALVNGEHIHAWYVPAIERGAPTLLFLHGARRNLSGSYGRIELMRSLGFNVLAIDYRGFGRSSRLLPSEQSAVEDTRMAFAELLRREPDPSRRFVYGYSLGGALAIDLAAHTDGIAGLIVEATFTSIPDLVRASRWSWVPLLNAAVTQEFNSISKITRVNEPLLLIHGTADSVIPHEMSDRLYAAAVNVQPQLRHLVKIDGATHWGAAQYGGETYVRAVREFVATAQAALRGGFAAAAVTFATDPAATAAVEVR
jgi:pimeloyl-ACP methyl ester carboxylesterase